MKHSGYHLFLDDERVPEAVTWMKLPPAPEWEIARSYNDFVRIVGTRGIPSAVSFDHDLAHQPKAGEVELTGSTCARWLAEQCVERGCDIPIYTIHSQNCQSADKIHSIMSSASRVIGMNRRANEDISALRRPIRPPAEPKRLMAEKTWLSPEGEFIDVYDHEPGAAEILGRDHNPDDSWIDRHSCELIAQGWRRVVLNGPDFEGIAVTGGNYGRPVQLNAAQRKALEAQAAFGLSVVDANTPRPAILFSSSKHHEPEV